MRLLLFNLATDADDPLLGFTTSWIRAIARRVTSIHVITMRSGRCDLPDNVTLHSVGKEKGYSEPRRALEFYRHLIRILHHQPIDVCFSHMIPAFVFLAGPLLKAKGIPIISWYSHLHIGWLARLSMHLSNRVVTAAPEVHEAFKNKCILTGHGIDLSLYTSNREAKLAERDEKYIVTVGRVSPVKDYDSFIEALALLYQSGFRNFQAWIVGSAPEQHRSYFSRIVAKTEKLGLDKRVRFLGWRPPAQIA
jgi:glycosyltransferase involved in cell wall biosynthesis